MDMQHLQALLPEIDEPALKFALENLTVCAAIADLNVVEAELARCAGRSKEKEDWEATKAELLDEIRRLTRSLSSKA